MIESFSPVDLAANLALETAPKVVKPSTKVLVIIVIIIVGIITLPLLADYLKNRQLERTKH